jgi:hypothetical protein
LTLPALKARPRVLLGSTLWWPLSARLATRFLQYGCDVAAICPPGHVMEHVAGISRLYAYRSIGSRASLEQALDDARPDIVVPCDDRVVWQLHELHRARPQLAALIERSLGPASEYGIVSRRERLLELAVELGVRVPETRAVRSNEDVRAWFAAGAGRSVIKIDGTWGGSGVQFVESYEDALRALDLLRGRGSLGSAVKRLVVNRDPLAAWTWRQRGGASTTIQRFVEGRPANAMVACWRGEVLAAVVVEVLSSQGPTGAGIVVRVVDNPEIARAAGLLAARLSLTGFYGLDFVIERSTGRPHLIEMNPRCTQLGHLALPKRGDLARAFCAKLAGRVDGEAPAPIGNEVVAFFPQSLLAEPRSRFASDAHLDVPWDHPALVRELLLPSWPDRHLIARLYHFFRPPRPSPTVDFDGPAPVAAARRGLGEA